MQVSLSLVIYHGSDEGPRVTQSLQIIRVLQYITAWRLCLLQSARALREVTSPKRNFGLNLVGSADPVYGANKCHFKPSLRLALNAHYPTSLDRPALFI